MMNHHHHGQHESNKDNEIYVDVTYEDGKLSIQLTNQSGDAPVLDTTHEKIMHLVVISSDLNTYYHLHPEAKGNGTYVQTIDLATGEYKIFVDVNPKGLHYTVKPIGIIVGESSADDDKHKLVADTNFTKTIEGHTVELMTDPIEVNKEVTFRFDVKDAKPEPYLGALGHVIITNESVHTFIHVHPLKENDTVFVAEFNEPGLYKMWAEFKTNGQVIAYPFVLDVQ